jgi:molecular chaperone DnaK
MGTDDILYTAEDGRKYKAKNILAILLKSVKETIEAKTGRVCDEAVISTPANYNDVQKQQTIEGAHEAGLKVLLLIHEPTAAALGNELHKKKDGVVLVFDLGGGTFDVSLVQVKGNLFEVIATGGERLGGRDFNECINQKVLDEFEAEHNYRPNQKEHPVFYQEMAQRVEHLKVSLSAQKQSQIVLSCDGDQFKTTITRDQFNSWVLPLAEKAMKRTELTVKEAKLDWPDISEVYAVGGGSMPPIIIELLEKLTGKKVSRRCEPHCAAALGAVIAGRLECARQGRSYQVGDRTLPPPGFYLREILSRPIGVATLDENDKEICCVMLAKNTPIPSIQTRIFKMTEPNQTEVLIRILDGEDDQEAAKCVELGRFELKDLPARPDLIGRIEIIFNLDANGMLTATARDIVSGKIAELQIAYKNKMQST